MILRYSRPGMLRAWSDTRRLERWFEVELAATGAREALGAVPAGTTARIGTGARLDHGRGGAAQPPGVVAGGGAPLVNLRAHLLLAPR